ncbi:Histone-lysine N-methyltransferase SETMAR-like [Oopsacas minuta]|uniref:Histone-lysine N-methyltransferase SETMAR-like n=1 Tax=Oopsacas minuta TaxID=111878 RepID=A0AAV7JR71_9METZ|nr:Histone-lysine N-methyltransferase SETMAR-like [Oopsacas minuta]
MRSGRPADAVNPENIQKVKKIIKNEHRIMLDEIMSYLDISRGSLHAILDEHLLVRKVAARWIPHKLSEEQMTTRVDWCKFMIRKFNHGRSKLLNTLITGDETWIHQYDPETKQQSSVWLFPDDDPPQKLRRARSDNKQMVASYISKKGHVATIPLTEQKTVTASWYVNICMPQVIEKWSILYPKAYLTSLQWHHDNASAHKADLTMDFFAENGIKLIPHPALSLDLVSCDFFLFPKLKKKIKGVHFNSAEEARLAYNEALQNLTQEDWENCFESWFRRMDLCIQSSGIYFEKL